jgi:hypothetical protein
MANVWRRCSRPPIGTRQRSAKQILTRTDTERRHANRMAQALADLGRLVGTMGTCTHHAEHGQNTTALRGDIEAMRVVSEHHHEALAAAGGLDAAHAEEKSHQAEVRFAFDAWFGHHRAITAHAGDCPCGNMHGGMMAH